MVSIVQMNGTVAQRKHTTTLLRKQSAVAMAHGVYALHMKMKKTTRTNVSASA
jgi:hypothetical protein